MKARLPQGMGGGMGGNMNNMIRQAQKIQADMEKTQAELNETEYKATVGGGAVEVTITGKKEVVALNIKPEVVDPEDIEMLEDLVISAVNEAIRTAEKDSEEKMAKITGGFGGGLPGMF